MITLAVAVVVAGAVACANGGDERTLNVGSKAFTEGVVLGELATAALEDAGFTVVHHKQLGGTRLVYSALAGGSIDAYAEYTGTLTQEIFAGHGADEIPALLAAQHIRMTKPLGFNNSYGLAMRADVADQHHVARISDLQAHPELRLGLSNEFLDRKDGWPSLKQAYALPVTGVRGMDHDVAYKALVTGAVDVVDCYTTDAEIAHYGLRVLDDDRDFFPRYDALYLYRDDLPQRAVDALSSLSGRISEREMSMMNARARIDRVPEREVARDFLALRATASSSPSSSAAASASTQNGARRSLVPTRTTRLIARTKEHVVLVGLALLISIAIGLPLGIVAAKNRRIGQSVLAIVGIVQTLP